DVGIALRRDETLLPSHGIPAAGLHAVPVVIARHENATGPACLEDAQLLRERAIGGSAGGGGRVRHAARVDIVAQEHDDGVRHGRSRAGTRPGVAAGTRGWTVPARPARFRPASSAWPGLPGALRRPAERLPVVSCARAACR